MIDIKFFGTYRIIANGSDITSKFSKKGKALLCYMIASEKSNFNREKLVEVFWDNYKRESAYSNLRYAVWQLRKIFKDYGEDIVITSHGKNIIEIEEKNTTNDLGELLNLKKSYKKGEGNGELILKGISDLYKGDFLEDFYICDNVEFNDWAFNIKENIQRFYFDSQMDLAEINARNNKLKEAIYELNKLINIDSLNEMVYHSIIKYQYLSGNKVAAVSTYRGLKLLLRKELNISPSWELQNFYNNIIKEETHSGVEENFHEYKNENASLENIRIKKKINIMMSKNPARLNAFYQEMAQYNKNTNEYIIDICNSPGKRINYEGIFEILNEVQNYFENSSVKLKEKFEAISSEIRNSNSLEEYYLFVQVNNILDVHMKADILIRVWNFHFLDSKSTDFISFIYRNIRNNGIRINGIVDEKWKNERLEFFIESFSGEEGFTIIK